MALTNDSIHEPTARLKLCFVQIHSANLAHAQDAHSERDRCTSSSYRDRSAALFGQSGGQQIGTSNVGSACASLTPKDSRNALGRWSLCVARDDVDATVVVAGYAECDSATGSSARSSFIGCDRSWGGRSHRQDPIPRAKPSVLRSCRIAAECHDGDVVVLRTAVGMLANVGQQGLAQLVRLGRSVLHEFQQAVAAV